MRSTIFEECGQEGSTFKKKLGQLAECPEATDVVTVASGAIQTFEFDNHSRRWPLQMSNEVNLKMLASWNEWNACDRCPACIILMLTLGVIFWRINIPPCQSDAVINNNTRQQVDKLDIATAQPQLTPSYIAIYFSLNPHPIQQQQHRCLHQTTQACVLPLPNFPIICIPIFRRNPFQA
jgi:hypothetical protein